MDIAWTIAKEGICAPTRAPGVAFSICRGCGKTVYGSPDVAGAGKQCREHRFRGNGAQVTICRGCGETAYRLPYVIGTGNSVEGHRL